MMSNAAAITSMPERQRRAGPFLPEDPSEEELARDGTLSEADRVEVLRCRGDDNRRRFALQLCLLRQYGRFLDRYQDVPVRILNHLNRQLGLMPAVSLPEAERDATSWGGLPLILLAIMDLTGLVRYRAGRVETLVRVEHARWHRV